MEIKASSVKMLRDETGAGMMECKKALEEAEGNFEKAREILRMRGLAAAQNRAAPSSRVVSALSDLIQPFLTH